MRIVTIFFLFFSINTLNGYCQKKHIDYIKIFDPFKPDSSNTYCISEMNRAIIDFESDNYVLQLEKPGSYSNTQKKVLEKYYNIHAKYPEFYIENCYNYYLKILINKKFGFDVLSKSMVEADSLDEIGLGNKKVEFIYKEGPNAYFLSCLTKKESKYLQKKYGSNRIYYRIEIDENGACNISGINYKGSIILRKEPLFNKYFDNKKLFNPRIVEGIPEKTWWVVPIQFK